jgi:transcriptional regulator with XRE-family HTH domain
MKSKKTIRSEQYKDLIEQLCQERQRLGLSQTEVAEYLNMRQSDISKIETGERRIDVLEFKALLKTYRVDENKKLKRLVEQFFELEKQ